MDFSDDAIIGKTLDAIITSWNKGAERIFGYTAEEIIGKSKTTLFPPTVWQKKTQSLHNSGAANVSSISRRCECEKMALRLMCR